MEPRQDDYAEESDEDDDLGQVMNEVAAMSFAEKETLPDDEPMEVVESDDEVS